MIASLTRISSIVAIIPVGLRAQREMHWAQLGGPDFHKRRGRGRKEKLINFAHNQEIHVNGKLGKGAFV